MSSVFDRAAIDHYVQEHDAKYNRLYVYQSEVSVGPSDMLESSLKRFFSLLLITLIRDTGVFNAFFNPDPICWMSQFVLISQVRAS